MPVANALPSCIINHRIIEVDADRLLTDPLLTLTDTFPTERESSLQVSIYRHLQLAGHPKQLEGTGR